MITYRKADITDDPAVFFFWCICLAAVSEEIYH